MIKLNKNEIIKYGLIASLFTNFTIGGRYYADSKEYKEKIEKLSMHSQKLDRNFKDLLEIYQENDQKSHEKSNKIVVLTNELEKVKNENKRLESENKLIHNENKKLKKKKQRKEVSSQRKLNMELTFYTANCRGCSGTTKTGINVTNTIYYKGYHVIAADPRVIKLHSIIKVQTKNRTFYGYVADTGGAIKGNILDVLVSSEDEAFKLGRQKATVTIIKEGK
ncbi:3D domain-containing protein [Bacillus xiapuensis]|uniref:3D domain-containing protein n=1 Tax=Bacillus xiapuensis TaxID=2014075 RepID=A0ABU6N857_9BACI|nr:3D domain-containing protein [Bacillus xiapuensis]